MLDSKKHYDGFFDRTSYDLDGFRALISRQLAEEDVPFAADIHTNVPIYDMSVLATALEDGDQRRALLSEWGWVLAHGAGVIALKAAYADTSVIDRASDHFRDIIEDERASGSGEGDHFAASGANDRVWNILQKHCLRDPEGYTQYYGNPPIAAACEAWLGPNYQMTAQLNQVRPGGQAQQAHRDYHLGFQSVDTAAQYPIHAHTVTATLTLQGAVAHCDMPVESGPTKLLPFSQLYGPGYLAFHDAAHREVFESAYIQVPLEKGDALFFNPALFHAAGANVSADILRMANLLQISSAFGRAMENVDRAAMARAILPVLRARQDSGAMTPNQAHAAIAATAEGYPFPTNLDTDPPVGGNAPLSQADLLRQALAEGWTDAQFADALTALSARQSA